MKPTMRRVIRTALSIAGAACLLQVVALASLLTWTVVDDRLSYTGLLSKFVERVAPKSFRVRDLQETWFAREITNPKWDPSSIRIWGYANRQSVPAGEGFDLMLSVGPAVRPVEGHVEILRIGPDAGEDQKLVMRSAPVMVKAQSVPASASSTGANWQPTLSITKTTDWRSGYYAADFVERNGERHRDVGFIVVTNPDLAGDVLIKLSTNTYNAYNRWGGHSLYRARYGNDPGYIVSFDRPTPPDFYRWEYHYVLWIEALAEAEGFSVDYATDVDVHRNKSFTENYSLVISVGHDEYWSKREFDNFYERIFVNGGNVLFLGANIAYWQVRYADVDASGSRSGRQRQMLSYKDAVDPIRDSIEGDPALFLANRFRDEQRRPETMLMGVAYSSYFHPDSDDEIGYPYKVVDADFPLFEATEFRTGEVLDKLVGYEWDNTDPAADGERLWKSGISRIPVLPRERLTVLFSGHGVDTGGVESPAEAVFFESPAGAKVFSAGTVRWAWALNKPGFENSKFRRFNENLVKEFLR